MGLLERSNCLKLGGAVAEAGLVPEPVMRSTADPSWIQSLCVGSRSLAFTWNVSTPPQELLDDFLPLQMEFDLCLDTISWHGIRFTTFVKGCGFFHGCTGLF